MVEDGDLWGARASLISNEITGRRPDVVAELCDVDLRLGLNQEVVNLLSPVVEQGFADWNELLPLSLASARLGRVFEGQKEYCASQLPGKGHPDFDSYLPRDSSAKSVATMSFIAMGNRLFGEGQDKALWYFEQAARLGGDTPYLNQMQAQIYAGQRRFPEAFARLDAWEKLPASQGDRCIILALRQQFQQFARRPAKTGNRP
jgi:hypothetical protein